MSDLRVCIDARLTSEAAGGVMQFVIGLAYGLSQLRDGDEIYHFLTYPNADGWIRPYLGENCHILRLPPAPEKPGWWRTLARLTPLRRIWHRLSTRGFSLPSSDGTIERAAMDVMHFTYQSAFLTGVPSIYHPHDLQHIHLPELFTPRVYSYREFAYRRFCDQAQMVAVASSWTRSDVIQQYGLAQDKVRVVPLAPTLEAYPPLTPQDVSDVAAKYGLPAEFIFYPAQTWAHKNHIGLLKAMALLRDEYALTVSFVSSGSPNRDFHPQVERQVKDLGLSSQVRFMGFVNPSELQALYRLCRCVVVPTKFEAACFPLMESFLVGAPAACSNVTGLPEQAGDAALIFDPDDTRQMADAIRRLWLDEPLRRTLVGRGQRRVAALSWKRTARLFRAHYRRLAGRALTQEDENLLSAPPLL